MGKKITFLFLALLLPGLVFIFLKVFGKNEFEIPVFYATSADSLNAVCGTHYTSPFRIPGKTLSEISWAKKKATVFLFNQQVNKELRRLPDLFKASDFEMIEVNPASGVTFSNCVFFLPPNRDLLLMDDKRQIRGYYNSTTREEVDRLVVEMKILLKQY